MSSPQGRRKGRKGGPPNVQRGDERERFGTARGEVRGEERRGAGKGREWERSTGDQGNAARVHQGDGERRGDLPFGEKAKKVL